MAIDVVERGVAPANMVYEVRCRSCWSLLSFRRHDAKYTADQRDGDFLTVECPICRESVHTNVSNGLRRTVSAQREDDAEKA